MSRAWDVPVYLPRRSRTACQTSKCRKCTCLVVIQVAIFFVCGVLFENHTRLLRGAVKVETLQAAADQLKLSSAGSETESGAESIASVLTNEEQEPGPENMMVVEGGVQLPEEKSRVIRDPAARIVQNLLQERAGRVGLKDFGDNAPKIEEVPQREMEEILNSEDIFKQNKEIAEKVEDPVRVTVASYIRPQLLPIGQPNQVQVIHSPFQTRLQIEPRLPTVDDAPGIEPPGEPQANEEVPEVGEEVVGAQQPLEVAQQLVVDMDNSQTTVQPVGVNSVEIVPENGPSIVEEAKDPVESIADIQAPILQQNQPIVQELQSVEEGTNSNNNPSYYKHVAAVQNKIINRIQSVQAVQPSIITTTPQPKTTQQPAPEKSFNPVFTWQKAFEDPATPYVVDCLTGGPLRSYNPNTPVTYFQSQQTVGDYVENPTSRLESFTNIHRMKTWLGGLAIDDQHKEIQSSGISSTLTTSAGIRNILGTVISEIKKLTGKPVVKILDAACGDMVWMSEFLSARNDIEYTGVDMVVDLIRHHQTAYASQSQWRFVLGDILSLDINEKFDLIIARQLMPHLTNRDAILALEKFSNSQSTFLLATTSPSTNTNTDLNLDNASVMISRYRHQNLELVPFRLSPPICMNEDSRLQKSFVGLWKLPLTQVVDCSQSRITVNGMTSCA